jgi:hypothetical protein
MKKIITALFLSFVSLTAFAADMSNSGTNQGQEGDTCVTNNDCNGDCVENKCTKAN